MKKYVKYSFIFFLAFGWLTLHSGNALATNYADFNNLVITGNTIKNTDSAQNATFANTFCQRVYIGDFPDTSTPFNFTSPVNPPGSLGGFHTECGNTTSYFIANGFPLASYGNYPFGSVSVAGDHLWVEYTFLNGGSTSDTMNTSGTIYYYQYAVDGSNVATLIPNSNVDGIVAQTLPTDGETTPYNVHFTGTYTNSTFYTQACVFLTSMVESIAPQCKALPLVEGVNLPYDFYIHLDPNITYTYTLQLFDGTHYTTGTTSKTFTTNALADNQVIIPVWTPFSCDWTDPTTYGGCLLNFAHDIFYPDQGALDQFTGLKDQYKNKPPFGYAVAIQAVLSNINDTNTSVFTLSSMPILNTLIFTPFRTALIWVLWVAFAFVLFHRFKNMSL